MADLRRAAQALAAQGRFGDTMLIHVNPAEVAGIASLMPGGLTVNPQTGLPEAFFFLPFLASMFAPAAAAAAPLAAAAAPALAAGATAAGTLASTIGAGLTAAAPLASAAAPLTAAANVAAAAPAVTAATSGLGSLAALPEVAGAATALPATAAAAPVVAPAAGIETLFGGLGTDAMATGSIVPTAAQSATLAPPSLIPPPVTPPAVSAAQLMPNPVPTPAVTVTPVPEVAIRGVPDAINVADVVTPSATTPRIPIPSPRPAPSILPDPGGAGGVVSPEGAASKIPIPETRPYVPSDIIRENAQIAADPWNNTRVATSATPNAATPGEKTGILGGLGKWIGKNPMMALGIAGMAAQALPGLFGGGGDDDDEDEPDLSKSKYRGGSAKFPGPDYKPGKSGEHKYFDDYPLYAKTGGLVGMANGGLVKGYAAGGAVDLQAQMPQDMGFPLNGVPGGIETLAPEQIPTSDFPKSQIGTEPELTAIDPEDDKELIMQTVEAIKGTHPNPDPVIMAFVKEFGEEALQDLVGRVKSAGDPSQQSDGQSDSVPIMASRGEYVVPADAVSGLGNGSTDAGAEQLQAMVQNVRQNRGSGPGLPPQIQGGIASMMSGGLVRGYQEGGTVEDDAAWYMNDPLNTNRSRFPPGLLESMGLGAARNEDAPMDQYDPYGGN